jgi:hypothetical protein
MTLETFIASMATKFIKGSAVICSARDRGGEGHDVEAKIANKDGIGYRWASAMRSVDAEMAVKMKNAINYPD